MSANAASRWDLKVVPERLPTVIIVTTFVLIGIWDHFRDLTLWRNYCFVGAIMFSILGAIVWDGRYMIPRTAFWLGYVGYLLHFVGGSLGAADRGPGPFCFGDLEPGQWLCADGVNGMYHVHDIWDRLTHGVAGIAGGYGMTISWRRISNSRRYGLSNSTLFWLGASLTIGLTNSFEVYEFFGKTWFGTIDQGGYHNTAGDLVSNVIGSCAGAALGLMLDRQEVFNFPVAASEGIPKPVRDLSIWTVPIVIVNIVAILDYLILRRADVESNYDELLTLLTIVTLSGLALMLLAMFSPSAKRTSEEE